MLHCWFCLPNFKLLFSQKGIFAEFFYPLIRNIRRIQFPECGARLNNFYLSKLLCIFPSLFAKNLNKARYNISYQFLALKDPVLRRNKATNSSTSNCPFFSCTESHIVLGNLFKVYRLDITFAREVCHLGKKKNGKMPVRMWWQIFSTWINYLIQGFSSQLKMDRLTYWSWCLYFSSKRKPATLKTFDSFS